MADLSLSLNPIGDAGVVAFADVLLRPKKLALVLPMLRWLHLGLPSLAVSGPHEHRGRALGDEGALALAAALRDIALPSLEVLWCFGEFSVTPTNEEGEFHGLDAIQDACDTRDVIFEGIDGPGAGI